MAAFAEIYRAEMETASEIFGEDKFLSVEQLRKRIGCSWETCRRLLGDDPLPIVGVSKARFALALSRIDEKRIMYYRGGRRK